MMNRRMRIFLYAVIMGLVVYWIIFNLLLKTYEVAPTPIGG